MFQAGPAAIADHAVSPAVFQISDGDLHEDLAREAGAATREGTTANAERVDLRLAQLMCSRVCHDLIGAAGALESGIELLEGNPSDAAEIHDLIGLSGRQLNRRLAFYRLAFGFAGGAGADAGGSLADARRVSAGLIDNSRVVLHWTDRNAAAAAGRCSAALVRLLLCAVLIASDALFRGGELRVAIDGGGNSQRFTIDAAGRAARIAEPVIDALAPDARLAAITARTVHAYYLGRLIGHLAARLDITQTTDGFSLSLTVPASA